MEIIAKNYRCYSGETPLKINLGKGVTSIIGMNNSGKSTIFRFFFEFRSLWKAVTHANINLTHSGPINVGIPIPEPQKIFCDNNARELSIKINLKNTSLIKPTSSPWIHTVEFLCSRENLNYWKINFYYKNNQKISTDKDNLKNKSGKFFYNEGNEMTEVSFSELFEAMEILSRIIYFGPNRYAIGKGGSEHYDLYLGNTFVNKWRGWKLGNETENKKIATKVERDIRNIFQFKSLQINPANDNEDMELVIDDVPTKLSELGDGISQFLITLGTAAIKRPSFIFIDEPEHGLHATMQLDFVTSLASYSEYGMILSTHSMGLARSVSDGKILSVKKSSNGSKIEDLETINNLSELLGSLNYSAYCTLGFTKILLVEGTTEVKVFQQFLRKFQIDHKLVIIPLGGDSLVRGGVEHEMAEIKRLANNNLLAIVDSERDYDNAPPKIERKEFYEMCKKLDIPCHLTYHRATENYFSQRAIDFVFSPGKHQALTKYEKHDKKKHWKKSENWRIAREMSAEELEASDIGIFIKDRLL